MYKVYMPIPMPILHMYLCIQLFTVSFSMFSCLINKTQLALRQLLMQQ